MIIITSECSLNIGVFNYSSPGNLLGKHLFLRTLFLTGSSHKVQYGVYKQLPIQKLHQTEIDITDHAAVRPQSLKLQNL